jgi:hypothetical protein
MKKTFYFIIFIIFCISCTQEYSEGKPVTKTMKEKRREHRKLILKEKPTENISYISIDNKGYPHQNRNLIIKALGKFEKEHPNLKILSIFVEFQQDAHSTTNPWTFGVWITHTKGYQP